ncbi:MAG: hypothetical protein ACYC1C_02115 [Chloroflexota bacterium]
MAQKRFLVPVGILLSVLMVATTLSAQAEPPIQSDSEYIANMQDFWNQAQGLPLADVTTDEVLFGFQSDLLAKAHPDACFYGFGCPQGISEGLEQCPECTPDGQPKVNQAYVWGLTKDGANLWFGTAPNVQCLVMGLYLGLTEPFKTDSWACEFGSSCVAKAIPALPPGLGDWWPAEIYYYDTATNSLVEKTPPELENIGGTFPLTVGIRSAGSANGVVILGGPALPSGINLFAYNAQTGEYLGAKTLPEFSNIRKWVMVDGALYAGVRLSTITPERGGAVIRWTGDVANPFQFEVVGYLDSEAAELAEHEGRLFVTTWPTTMAEAGQTQIVNLAGLFMSPLLGDDGLTAADADRWTKVWKVSDYEPDPITAMTSAGGALASFNGYLYWGTMHVPGVSTLAHLQAMGYTNGNLPSVDKILATFLGSYRPIEIFRGQNFADTKDIDLLYGEPALPVYQNQTGQWTLEANKMGPEEGKPLYGHSGFGNYFNNYTWTMGVYDDKLMVGTMDWSYLAADLVKAIVNENAEVTMTSAPPLPLRKQYGADLWAFKSAGMAAVPLSTDGVDNYTNYGIRTMVPSDEALYLGMANPMNLLTNPDDDLPEGGWELIAVTEKEKSW